MEKLNIFFHQLLSDRSSQGDQFGGPGEGPFHIHITGLILIVLLNLININLCSDLCFK